MPKYATIDDMVIDAYYEISNVAWDDGDSDSKLKSIQSLLYQVEASIDSLTSHSQSVEYTIDGDNL